MLSKKEKKAIKLLKQQQDLPFIYCERENAIRIVLKLIKKQQKEIEELNKALMTASLKIEGLKIEAVYNNNYISKDKIRKKIEELEETIKKKRQINIKEWVGFEKNEIEILEELLEED